MAQGLLFQSSKFLLLYLTDECFALRISESYPLFSALDVLLWMSFIILGPSNNSLLSSIEDINISYKYKYWGHWWRIFVSFFF